MMRRQTIKGAGRQTRDDATGRRNDETRDRVIVLNHESTTAWRVYGSATSELENRSG
jgi:hypothetical protein